MSFKVWCSPGELSFNSLSAALDSCFFKIEACDIWADCGHLQPLVYVFNFRIFLHLILSWLLLPWILQNYGTSIRIHRHDFFAVTWSRIGLADCLLSSWMWTGTVVLPLVLGREHMAGQALYYYIPSVVHCEMWLTTYHFCTPVRCFPSLFFSLILLWCGRISSNDYIGNVAVQPQPLLMCDKKSDATNEETAWPSSSSFFVFCSIGEYWVQSRSWCSNLS